MFDRITEFVNALLQRHSGKVFAGVLVFIVLAMAGLAKFGSEFGYRIWFFEKDPYLLNYDKFEKDFGNDDNIVLGIHSPSGIFDEDSIQLIAKLTDEMWLLPEVIRVDSLTNFHWTRSEEDEIIIEPLFPEPEEATLDYIKSRETIAMNHPRVPRFLLSEDGKTALIYGRLKPLFGKVPPYKMVNDAMMSLINGLENTGDHKFYVTGAAAMSAAFQDISVGDIVNIVPFLLLVIAVLLYYCLRSFSAIGLTFLIIFATIGATFGISGWLGVKFNTMTAALPQIIIGICIADAVHVLTSLFLYSDRSQSESLAMALKKNVTPTLLTTITTSLGFFTLLTSKLGPVHDLGLMAGIGVTIAWFVSLSFIAFFSLRFNLTGQSSPSKPSPIAKPLVHWLEKHRTAVIVTFVSLTTFGVYSSSKVEVNSSLMDYFADSVPVKQSNTFLLENLGGAKGVEIVVKSPHDNGIKNIDFLKEVDSFQAWIRDLPKVTKVLSTVEIIKDINRSLNGDRDDFYKLPDNPDLVAHELLLYNMSMPSGMSLSYWNTMDQKRMRINVLWTLETSKDIIGQVRTIEAYAKNKGLDVEVTGKANLMAGMNDHIVSTFFSSIGLSLLTIAIIMILIFKSLKIGLLAMIPNVVPPILGGAVMAFSGTYLDVGTVVVVSVCLGIAVDDTIHFMTHYLDEIGKGRTRKEALEDLLGHTGKALVYTTLILVLGFGTFMFGRFLPSVNFGVMTAIILTMALVTDLILLPAILLRKGVNS